MNNRFDELAKSLAQSVTRRAALRKSGLAITGVVLAFFGLANQAEAGHCKPGGSICHDNSECCSGYCLPAFPGKKNGTGYSKCTY